MHRIDYIFMGIAKRLKKEKFINVEKAELPTKQCSWVSEPQGPHIYQVLLGQNY